jgi:2-hydroxymuconate-semialdehyde hydrolase
VTAERSTLASPELGTMVTAGGIRTNVHDAGSGAPVLLIHGSGPGVSAWANWRFAIPRLASRLRVIAPDIVGFGYTDPPESFKYSLSQWRDHLLAVLDALGVQKASVVGNSFGGALALSLAAAEPARVDRLVLMGSVGVQFPLTSELDAIWGYEPSLDNMRALMHTFAYDQTIVNDELVRLRYEASTRRETRDAYAEMFPAPRQSGIDALCLPEDSIRALPHRTLLIHGRDDRVIPMQTSLRLLELIPKSELHIYGNCGHWVQIERSGEFVDLVARFLTA